MYLKELNLRGVLPEEISTEIMYEVASARAERKELLRINILNEETDNVIPKKRLSSLLRTLKTMKADGRIQFFATKDSFDVLGTEAVFLQNKYPELFASLPQSGKEELFVYIKL